jgi:hypothetical protein
MLMMTNDVATIDVRCVIRLYRDIVPDNDNEMIKQFLLTD